MNMLKAGIKRRRTQRQITDEKAEEALRQQSIEEKLAKFDELNKKYEEAKKEAETNNQARAILSNFIENGEAQVDNNGNVRLTP